MVSPEKAYNPLPAVEKNLSADLQVEAANDANYFELQKMATDEMENILSNEKYSELETLAEKSSLLRSLILERGASIGDTSEPVDNSQRFLVELLAKELSSVEKLEDEEMQALMESRQKQVT